MCVYGCAGSSLGTQEAKNAHAGRVCQGQVDYSISPSSVTTSARQKCSQKRDGCMVSHQRD